MSMFSMVTGEFRPNDAKNQLHTLVLTDLGARLNDIWENFCLFHHQSALMYGLGSIKFLLSNFGVEELALTPTPSDTSEQWNAAHEPDLIAHHKCQTSLKLLRSIGNIHSIPAALEVCMDLMVWCPPTLLNRLYTFGPYSGFWPKPEELGLPNWWEHAVYTSSFVAF